MTATVHDLSDEQKRREADRIGLARPDVTSVFAAAKARHPATVSKQLAQVQRQQVLGSLVAAVGDGKLSVTDDADLPLIVDVLLRHCPQAYTHPDVVAKSLAEAGQAWEAEADVDDESHPAAGEAALIVSQLAAGTAHTAVYGYLREPVQLLIDWLTAAGAR